jgi:hypothetical protein
MNETTFVSQMTKSWIVDIWAALASFCAQGASNIRLVVDENWVRLLQNEHAGFYLLRNEITLYS